MKSIFNPLVNCELGVPAPLRVPPVVSGGGGGGGTPAPILSYIPTANMIYGWDIAPTDAQLFKQIKSPVNTAMDMQFGSTTSTDTNDPVRDDTNGYLTFDGINDYLIGSSSSAGDMTAATTNFTILATVFIDASATGTKHICYLGGHGIHWVNSSGNRYFMGQYRVTGSTKNLQSNLNVPVQGAWYVVGFSNSSAGDHKIFINGADQTRILGNPDETHVGNFVNIGYTSIGENTGLSNTWHGRIANVVAYNQNFSAADHLAYYNAIKAYAAAKGYAYSVLP